MTVSVVPDKLVLYLTFIASSDRTDHRFRQTKPPLKHRTVLIFHSGGAADWGAFDGSDLIAPCINGRIREMPYWKDIIAFMAISSSSCTRLGHIRPLFDAATTRVSTTC